jgi:ABC-type uncharacterized transport system permease subunit
MLSMSKKPKGIHHILKVILVSIFDSFVKKAKLISQNAFCHDHQNIIKFIPGYYTIIIMVYIHVLQSYQEFNT